MEYGWTSLRQFTNWWWRNNRPLLQPENRMKVCDGSVETVLFRKGPFQVERIFLYAGVPVPPHTHPNVDTYETHLMGSGNAWIEDVKLKYSLEGDTRHPKYRRLLIKAGQSHWGIADTDVEALSFQEWLNGVPPTFITDDWVGDPWE